MVQTTMDAQANPYWAELSNVAPIKAEYVLWDKMKPGRYTGDQDDADDAAEGRGGAASSSKRKLDDVERGSAIAQSTSSIVTSDGTTGIEGALAEPAVDQPMGEDGDEPAVKKVRLKTSEKKALRRAEADAAWELKKAAKAAAKLEDIANGGTGKKQKGQNKGRVFDHRAGVESRICGSTGRGEECDKTGQPCRWNHDLAALLATRLEDIPIVVPASDESLESTISTARMCPNFAEFGKCLYGFKCRFGLSHMKLVEAGTGLLGSDWILVVDQEKVDRIRLAKGSGLLEIGDRGEMNTITMDKIKTIRGQGLPREERFPLTTAYLTSIGEPVDAREMSGGKEDRARKEKGKGGKGQDKATTEDHAPSGVYVVAEDDEDAFYNTTATETVSVIEPVPTPPTATLEAEAPTVSTVIPADVIDSPSAPSANLDLDPVRIYVPDIALVRATEKKTLDFRGKLWLAPLTTVGNLPFRRLCGTYGNDISCSEMGLSQEFLAGNANEWSLVRRHPSEKTFGIQICGSRPQSLVPAAEAIVKSCNIDFLDVNCGCPIDLVFNKGAGSALLQHAQKLGKSLVGMSRVLGEIPLTIKIRTGVSATVPVAHKLVTKMQTEWGVSALTQRYKTMANYEYIGTVAQTLRETAADAGLPAIPIFGNGDAYDYRAYYENMESSGVDGIMIARGALIKPWIFTEIKERRDWDISSRERLDMIGQLAEYGLQHWGSDLIGVNTTRRFLCEALSFQHRYVPVGLLERLPTFMNDRSYPYKGRDSLETLLASESSEDWVKLTSMFLGPPPESWSFAPKHKSNATDTTAEVQG